jgi:hypothetical protein
MLSTYNKHNHSKSKHIFYANNEFEPNTCRGGKENSLQLLG